MTSTTHSQNVDSVRPRLSGKVPGRVTNQLQFLKKVTENMWHHASAYPFYRPVDEKQAANYYEVIEKPMDMGTIKDRLRQNYYSSASDCIQDFRLMFANCHAYNYPGDEVIIMCEEF